jgi:vacuolar-type H+-ATPase subunit E/Vma4
MMTLILAASEVSTTTAILSAISGALGTLITGYFKYKQAAAKAKLAAEEAVREEAKEAKLAAEAEAKAAKEEREKEFQKQLERQQESHNAMLEAQKKAFQKQIDAVVREKKDLLIKIKSLEDTVEEKIEQIIDLATQNSRREGMLEVLKNGNSAT